MWVISLVLVTECLVFVKERIGCFLLAGQGIIAYYITHYEAKIGCKLYCIGFGTVRNFDAHADPRGGRSAHGF